MAKFQIFLEEKPKTHDPITRLARALILSALNDTKSKRREIREEAISWIFGEKNYVVDFDSCCHVVGINPDVMREKIEKTKGGKQNV